MLGSLLHPQIWTNNLIFLGFVSGLTSALVAMGIVLVYRSTRVINFAVANIGFLGTGLFALLVVQYSVPFWLAAVIGVVVAILYGAVIELIVIRRLFTAPRVIVLVATIGIAQRARDKQLTPDEVQGGTFTITNPGGYGTFHGTPVISQPQAAILGTYAVVKRAWVIQDELGQDVIAIRPIMNLTLTYDHRLVDGAYAGMFLRDLRDRLESWDEAAY